MASPQITPSDNQRNQLRAALIEKCWKDPEFKTQIIADPKGMYEKHTGRKMPDNFKLIIHEEDANTLHFSIPQAPSATTELSDEELERVAGGSEVIIVLLTLVGASVAASVYASAVAGAGKADPW
jgi:Nitrile hydratase, alpha chain